MPLTYVGVPVRVDFGETGQTTSHRIKAQVLTGLDVLSVVAVRTESCAHHRVHTRL